jgi:hypothetical protein
LIPANVELAGHFIQIDINQFDHQSESVPEVDETRLAIGCPEI